MTRAVTSRFSGPVIGAGSRVVARVVARAAIRAVPTTAGFVALVAMSQPALAQRQPTASSPASMIPMREGRPTSGGISDDSTSATGHRNRRRFFGALAVGASEHRESNVRFLLPADVGIKRPTGDAYHQASADAIAGVTGARFQLQAEARGDIARFATLQELDRNTYDVGGQLTRRWTPRLNSLTAVRAVTSTGVAGLGDGVDVTGLLPLVMTRTTSAVQSLSVQTGPVSALWLTLDGSRVQFDDRSFAGGTTVGLTLEARRTYEARRQLAWVLEARHVKFTAQPVVSSTAAMEWQRPVARATWTMRLGATAVGVQPSGPGVSLVDSLQVEPSGAVTIEQPIGRAALRVRAAREVRAGFGYGRALLTDAASLGYVRNRPGGSGAAISLEASRNVDPFDAALRVRYLGATLDWYHPVGPATVALNCFARRRFDGLSVDNLGASLQLRFVVGRSA